MSNEKIIEEWYQELRDKRCENMATWVRDWWIEKLEARKKELIDQIEKMNDQSVEIYKDNLRIDDELCNEHAQAIAIRNELINLINEL